MKFECSVCGKKIIDNPSAKRLCCSTKCRDKYMKSALKGIKRPFKKRKPLSKKTKHKISTANSGENHGMWSGGKSHTLGYIKVLMPKHPHTDSKYFILGICNYKRA